MRTVIFANIFLLFLFAPFFSLFKVASEFDEISKPMIVSTDKIEVGYIKLKKESEEMNESIMKLGMIASQHEEVYKEHVGKLTVLSEESLSYKNLSDDIYEQKILNMLGSAIHAHISKKVEIKIFELNELGYRGYIAKVKLFDPKAFSVALPNNKLGGTMTTSEAARAKGAILAINGGGFYKETKNGKSYTQLIGNTVIDSKLVEPFNGYPGDLFFAGINKQGEFVGNIPQTEAQLKSLNPYQGVSFIPILLKDGKIVNIPKEWKETKQPRTIIGSYANDDLILIVVDGRQGDWSVGVTLERLQEKLLELGVKNAYNLDGGGSSAMYYNGNVLNRPSDGKQRPVANNILIMP